MDRCIFCKNQTNNEYSYYVADKSDGVREKITLFACTKCLKKKGAITLSIISFFFFMSIIAGFSDLASGNRPKEDAIGGLIVSIILTLILLIWAIRKVYIIIIDKPLPEAEAVKKLIKKAKKINPLRYYFTPAENMLLPVKNEVQEKPTVQINEEMASKQDCSTQTDMPINDSPAADDTAVTENNTGTGKLICPKCGSEDIKLPSNITSKLFDRNEPNMMNTVMKANLGFLYGIVGDSVLKFKCRHCNHKW